MVCPYLPRLRLLAVLCTEGSLWQGWPIWGQPVVLVIVANHPGGPGYSFWEIFLFGSQSPNSLPKPPVQTLTTDLDPSLLNSVSIWVFPAWNLFPPWSSIRGRRSGFCPQLYYKLVVWYPWSPPISLPELPFLHLWNVVSGPVLCDTISESVWSTQPLLFSFPEAGALCSIPSCEGSILDTAPDQGGIVLPKCKLCFGIAVTSSKSSWHSASARRKPSYFICCGFQRRPDFHFL